MSILANLLGGSVVSPIEAVGKVLDKLFTSDDERLGKKILMEKLAQKPSLAQIELNKVEASHRSIFVAGWRPFIGWTCGAGLGFVVIINPLIAYISSKPAPQIPEKLIFDLIIALLGLGMYRTFEKIQGRTK